MSETPEPGAELMGAGGEALPAGSDTANKTDDDKAYEELRAKLGHTSLMTATPEQLAEITEGARRRLQPGVDTWLSRWTGTGLGDQVVEFPALLQIGQNFGNTVRWFARSLFSGGNEIGMPGTRGAFAGSLLLVMGPGLREQPRFAGTERYYPTIEGGRVVAATIAASNDDDQLAAIFGGLTKSAAKAYANTLEVVVERELTLTTVIVDDEGPKLASIKVEQARDDLAYLSRKPRTKTTTEVVFGVFRALDDRKDGKFVISPETKDGKPLPEVAGKIAPEVLASALAIRSRVKAKIRVTAPIETWLPRAPRVERVLVAVEAAPRGG
jgi:hypothetical protein